MALSPRSTGSGRMFARTCNSALLALLAIAACASREPTTRTPFDAGARDAARVLSDAGMDATTFDAAAMDSGARLDAAPTDAAPRDAAPVDAPPALPDGARPIRDIGTDAPAAGCRLALEGVCTSETPSVYDGPCGARELHVIGQYQPAGGTVTVTVARLGAPVVLALSSYEPTTWNVVIEPGAVVERILLDGYNTQTVVAPATVPVDNRSGGPGPIACAYRWPSDTGGCDTVGLVASLFTATGLRPTSFIGCYEGSSYRVGE